MQIKGWYKKDGNFTYVYTGNSMYIIAHNSGEWSFIQVGDHTYEGRLFDREYLKAQKKKCKDFGGVI